MEYVALYFLVGLITLWVYIELLSKNYDPIGLPNLNKYVKISIGYVVWPYILFKIVMEDINPS